MPHEVVAKLLSAGNRIKYLVAYIKAIVLRGHRCPLEIAAGQKIEHFFRTSLGADITNIVHAHIPFVAVAFVGMCVTTCRVVLFQHADFPAKFAEQCRARQPAHARANDDRIVLGSETFGSVTVADTQSTGFHCQRTIFPLFSPPAEV